MPENQLAIAHDYLTQRGGAEKVVLALTRAFPKSPVYTLLFNERTTYPEFRFCDIRVSWLNRVPIFRKFHRLALPILPLAARTTKVSAQFTIVSSSGWAHGFRTSGAKIVYCYSPARWLYQQDAYLGPQPSSVKRLALKLLSPALQRWDRKQARTATRYIAISTVVQQRIQEVYGIDAEVLPAPHSINSESAQESVDISGLGSSGEGFYLCISRLLPYKNVGAVIEAFNSLNLPLIVVGKGPEERSLKHVAGPSVQMLKDLTDAQIRWLYAHCNAVIAASYEDFGLTPLEAAVYGKPAVVLRWGGFLDTVREGETGVFFDRPDPELIRQAVEACRGHHWDEDLIKTHAATFSEERFIVRLSEIIGFS